MSNYIPEKYYTDEGMRTMKARLKAFVDMYNKTPTEAYPINVKLYGFLDPDIKNESELIGRIKELAETLGMGTAITDLRGEKHGA